MHVSPLLKIIAHPLAGIFCLSVFTSQVIAKDIRQETDPHAHHRQMAKKTGYTSSLHNYAISDITLINKDSNKISLSKALGDSDPVILNFIFTTCTTICPILSATLSQVQTKLGSKVNNLRMISITIDPEQDTPERLKEYAGKFKAGSNWEFLTGSIDNIVATQKIFDAYRGDKMNHIPLTFLRYKIKTPWVRLEGFTSATEVANEYYKLLSQ